MNHTKCFKSICTYCGTVVPTKTDQSINPKFVCSKACNTKIINKCRVEEIDKKFGPKVNHKYSDHYIPSFLLNYLPMYWFQNDVRCDKCHLRFYSDDVPDFCYDCIEKKISISAQCIKCSISYSATPYKIKEKNYMCTSCFNTSECEFTCKICKNSFIDTHNTYNHLNAAICKMCRNSNTIKHWYLHNYTNNDTINQMLDINPKFKIKIHYNLINNSADDNDTCVIEFPLMAEFNYNDELLMTNDKFRYFYTPPPDTSSCDITDTKHYEIVSFEIYSN